MYSPVPVYWNLRGEEVQKTMEKGGAVMRLVPVVWHETSVNNTSSKYIGRKKSRNRQVPLEWMINVLAQIVVAESYTLSRRIPTPTCPL